MRCLIGDTSILQAGMNQEQWQARRGLKSSLIVPECRGFRQFIRKAGFELNASFHDFRPVDLSDYGFDQGMEKILPVSAHY